MQSAESISWDRETDTVVVGSGGAGLVAALAASDNSCETVVLEKASTVGGTTAVSGGGVWIPNSRPIVEERGEMADEKVSTYIQRVAGDRVAEAMIEQFVTRGPDIVDYLEKKDTPGVYLCRLSRLSRRMGGRSSRRSNDRACALRR